MATNTLHKKIFEIKQKVGKISKDSTNPFFNSKYFDVNKLLEHLEPMFEERKILCLQPIIDGKTVVTRLIDLESDETLESGIDLPPISDAQKIGSCITYYRRYSLQSLLGLQAEDDDANKASAKATSEKKEKDLPWLNVMDNQKNFTKQWSNVVSAIGKGKIKSVADVRKAYKVSKEVEAKINELINQK